MCVYICAYVYIYICISISIRITNIIIIMIIMRIMTISGQARVAAGARPRREMSTHDR